MNFDIYKNISFSQAGINGIPGGGGSGTITTSFQTDSGVATPAAGIITFNAISQAGSTVLFSGSGSTVRLNVTDTNHNTNIGLQSGNAGSSGLYNSALGYQSMNAAVSSSDNSAFGATALKNLVSGGQNTAVGSTVMQNLQTGDANVGVGVNALFDANGANRNTAIGTAANADCSVGSNNTMVGWQSGQLVTSGSFNSYFGSSAGGNTTFTDSNNIMIGNIGTIGDNNKIIIGTQGAGAGQQNTCFIAGINGVTSANARMVTINSVTNQLGEQAIPSGNISITGDSGGALSSNAFTFTGGSTGLTFAGAGTTETLGGTLAIANGGTNATSMATSTGIVKYDGTRLVTSSTALIDSSNRYTNTSQPAFLAYLSSSQSNVTGNNVNYTIPFDTIITNIGSNYSNPTFTAPVTGNYYFQAQAYLISADGTQNQILMLINTTAHIYQYIVGAMSTMGVAGGQAGIQASGVFPMSAGDTATISVKVLGGNKTVAVYSDGATPIDTFFSGYLVC